MDGVGWLLDKHFRLMKTFPGMTLDYVECELTSAQGWAAYAWAVENEVTMAGPLAERKGLGYIGQERERRLAGTKEHNG